MKAEHWENIKEHFLKLLSLEPDQRSSWLDRLGQTDPQLRRELTSLLDSYQEMTGFLESSIGKLPFLPAHGLKTGRRIKSYRILGKVGEGGMGTVYEALREDEVFTRRVALKVVRLGMDTAENLKRFQREREILGRLDHPYLARILDGGALPNGLPYLVMDFVEGEPLLEYCDSRRLRVRERVQLFCKICEAVEYAHRNLVVHRDLKPANVLVTEQGDPKLLDFGIAKLLDANQESSQRTVTRLLTPDYASPEQVRGEAVSTATDVYSLGVVLYELLTGHRPFEASVASPSEMERLICDVDPELPSRSVLQTVEISYPSGRRLVIRPSEVARKRGEQAASLSRKLKGDLDVILMKALHKEAEQRYASVGQFREDLQRYLRGEPVLARPPSRLYLTRKFLRRHRGAVTAAVMVLLTLLAGLLATAWQAQIASQERDRAVEEAQRSRRILEFLQGMIYAPAPGQQGPQVTMVEVLDKAAPRVDQELGSEPAVAATVHATLAYSYRALGRYGEAERHLRAALQIREQTLDPQDPDFLTNVHNLGLLLKEQGNFEEAEKYLQEAVRGFEEIGQRTAQANALNSLGSLLEERGRRQEGARLQEQALELLKAQKAPSEQLLPVMHNLALFYHNQGDHLARAAQLQEEVLHLARIQWGERHPQVAAALHNLASVRESQGRLDEARRLYQEALAMRREVLGEEHPDTLLTALNLAGFLSSQGSLQQAWALAAPALNTLRRSLGEHPLTAYALLVCGQVRLQAGEPGRAFPYLEQAVRMRRRLLGPEHWLVASAEGDLGEALLRLGRRQEGKRLLQRSHQLLRAEFGPHHPRTLRVAQRLQDLTRP